MLRLLGLHGVDRAGTICLFEPCHLTHQVCPHGLCQQCPIFRENSGLYRNSLIIRLVKQVGESCSEGINNISRLIPYFFPLFEPCHLPYQVVRCVLEPAILLLAPAQF